MGERDQLAHGIAARVAEYEKTGEPDRVVGLDALTEAAALWRLIAGSPRGTNELVALGKLFWSRFTARPESDEGQTDLATAFELVILLSGGNPMAMPDYFREGLQQFGSYVEAYADANSGGQEERLAHAEAVVRRSPGERPLEEARVAVEDCRYALRYISVTSPGYSRMLAIKGTALLLLFVENRDPALLREAERVRRQVLAIEAPGEPGRCEALVDLIACLRFRWDHDSESDVLRECAALGRDLVDLPTNDLGRRLTAQFFGGQALHTLAVDSRDTELLSVAVTVLRAAAASADRHHDQRKRVLVAYELSTALLHKHQSEHDVQALREALRATTVATIVTHPDLAPILTNRMHAAYGLAEATRDRQMMLETARLARDAVRIATENSADPLPFHVQLIDFLRRFHVLSGDREWLWQGVVAARDAKAATPPDHPARPAMLTRLCSGLLDHYEIQPNHINLGEAVGAGQEAYRLSRADDPERGHYLRVFGKALYVVGAGRHANRRLYIALAVAVTEEALDATPSGHPARWVTLNRLGVYLLASFQLGGPAEHLSRAIDIMRQALAEVESLPPDGRDRVTLLTNLATGLHLLADRENSLPQLEEARELARSAVASAPNDGMALVSLGNIVEKLYEWEYHQWESGRRALHEARNAFARAVETDDLSPAVHVDAYRSLAWTHMMTDDPANALAAYARAIELLPRVSSRLLWRGDREMGLARTAGLAAEAASAAVAAGCTDQAIELLERARGTLLAETMDRRGILATLEDHDPELAKSYEKLLQHMELYDTNPGDLALVELELGPGDEEVLREFMSAVRAGGEDDAGLSLQAKYRHMYAQVEANRQDAEQHLNYLLPRIRRVPGLETFMLPLSAATLRREATEGPIALINTSRFRSDALIVTEHGVQNVRLERVDQTAIVDRVAQLHRAQESLAALSLNARREGEQAISDLLGWLWDNITEPVLDALGYTACPEADDPSPRIWWCPIGDAVPLPLHAAGHHDERTTNGAARTVLDRVISSYTPTIRALHQTRRTLGARATEDDTRQRSALIVAVPELPGAERRPLHAALAEARRVNELISDSHLLTGADAHSHAVSDALRTYGLVHLACHGISDWSDPDGSKLLLHDYDEHPFTLTVVGKTHLPGAALAYLSACETSQGTPSLHDESIHITSAFQLAGYRHVIGTLWPVNDEAARHIADAFYTTLTNSDTGTPHPEQASLALHHAVRKLRAQCRGKSPSLWAAHIHVGA